MPPGVKPGAFSLEAESLEESNGKQWFRQEKDNWHRVAQQRWFNMEV